ncbi:hypothetical protein M427DRAFT_70063 [Gonapodya prolifera JEL478]|uniref:Uncharacterized protein n=1 Tax=Gonapodya prolifera (strain JEL478) TaxID=1344416 RepID=A0A139AFE0_GONPJ|nr:hypothetical protein M427DRAFT_70063 [Gonapodya prolifera JEL478]|eukprot:KXS15478.1 hypothetical protein M427DRAFT_70063 [Gonapodya prolifera JEL478]
MSTNLLDTSRTSSGSDTSDLEQLASYNAKLNSVSSMAAMDARPRGGMGGFVGCGGGEDAQDATDDDPGMNDPIIRDILSRRQVFDVAPELEAERLRRMFIMLRHSKKYKRAQVSRANETWDRWNDQLQHVQATTALEGSSGFALRESPSTEYMQSRTASYAKASESSSLAEFNEAQLESLDLNPRSPQLNPDVDAFLETSSINISANSLQVASPLGSPERVSSPDADPTSPQKPRGFFAFRTGNSRRSVPSTASPTSPTMSALTGLGSMVRNVASKLKRHGGKSTTPLSSTPALSHTQSEPYMPCQIDRSRTESMSSMTILRPEGRMKRKLAATPGSSKSKLELPSISASQPQSTMDFGHTQTLPNMATRLNAGTHIDSLAEKVVSSLESIAESHARKRSRTDDSDASTHPLLGGGFVAPAPSMCPSGLLDLSELEAALQAVSATEEERRSVEYGAPTLSDDGTESDCSITSIAESIQTAEEFLHHDMFQGDIAGVESAPPFKPTAIGGATVLVHPNDLPHVRTHSRPRTSGSVSSSRASVSSLRHGILRNSAGTARSDSRRDSRAGSASTLPGTIAPNEKNLRPVSSGQQFRPVSGTSEATATNRGGYDTPGSEAGTLVGAPGVLGVMTEEGEGERLGTLLNSSGPWREDETMEDLELFPKLSAVSRPESKTPHRHSLAQRATPSKRRSRAVSFDDHVEVIAEKAGAEEEIVVIPGLERVGEAEQ